MRREQVGHALIGLAVVASALLFVVALVMFTLWALLT